MLRHAVVLVAVAAAVSGCGKPRAKTPVVPPAPLLTPAPPERVIIPAPHPVAVTPPAEPPIATQPAAPAPTSQGAPRPTPAPAAVAPPEQPAVVSVPPVLETTLNAKDVERQANELLAAAQRDVDQLERMALSAAARGQLESAKGFINQAREALKVKNVVLAKDLAEKAATLANQLKR